MTSGNTIKRTTEGHRAILNNLTRFFSDFTNDSLFSSGSFRIFDTNLSLLINRKTANIKKPMRPIERHQKLFE
jgi:hypothetical protein